MMPEAGEKWYEPCRRATKASVYCGSYEPYNPCYYSSCKSFSYLVLHD